MEDWNLVTMEQIQAYKANTLVNKHGGLLRLLQKYASDKFTQSTPKEKVSGKNQVLLFRSLQQLFPHTEIRSNFKHPDLCFKSTNASMELDVFLPSMSLAIEYQGRYAVNNKALS
jgi:hypothetical protein